MYNQRTSAHIIRKLNAAAGNTTLTDRVEEVQHVSDGCRDVCVCACACTRESVSSFFVLFF
jgi:hypothetical protein